MGYSHYEVCKHFAQRSSNRDMKGHNIYTGNNNTYIYSYGDHFPMAFADDKRKLIVINGDRYSVTTSKHQGEIRGALQSYLPSGYQQIVLPFTVIRTARVSEKTITPVATEGDYEDAYCKTHDLRFYSDYNSAWTNLNNHKSEYGYECETTYFHRLGGSLFKAKTLTFYGERGWKYFLSGFDETHNGNSDGYFISQLPHPVKTIEEAYESLKPKIVRDAIAAGLDVKRQGDTFAIPVEGLNPRKMSRQKSSLEPVYDTRYVCEDGRITDSPPRPFLGYDEDGKWLGYGEPEPGEYKRVVVRKRLDVPTFAIAGRNSHGASEIATDRYGRIFARGTLLHRPQWRRPEHKPIRLGKTWHRIVFNTAKASWQSTSGRVD